MSEPAGHDDHHARRFQLLFGPSMAQLGAPLPFTTGNHDITGPGAVAAFAGVFHPFLSEQARTVSRGAAAVKSGSYAVECGNAQFAFFDAYDPANSLDWLEALIARRTAAHLFVVVHPPVVPTEPARLGMYFSNARERARRDKFLALLGEQHALVIGGHIHRYNTLSRAAGRGRFAQFALSSVLSAPTAQPKDLHDGDAAYAPDQIVVEPNFSPANADERRAVYTAERAHVRDFAYADLPGYAVVTINGPRVIAKMFSGATRDLWRTVDLAALAKT